MNRVLRFAIVMSVGSIIIGLIATIWDSLHTSPTTTATSPSTTTTTTLPAIQPPATPVVPEPTPVTTTTFTPVSPPTQAAYAMVNGCVIKPSTTCRNDDLSGANLSGTDLSWSDFTDSTMVAANLAGTNLTGGDFAGVNLNGANLTGANLGGADIIVATNVTGVIWSNTTCPDKTNSDNDGGTCTLNENY